MTQRGTDEESSPGAAADGLMAVAPTTADAGQSQTPGSADLGAPTQKKPARIVTRAGARATTSSREDSQEEERAATPANDVPSAAAPVASSPDTIHHHQTYAGANDQISIKTSTQET